jgi:hypothetical protein
MSRVVVPLSNAARFRYSLKTMLIGIIIHIFCVGIPISLNIRKYGR